MFALVIAATTLIASAAPLEAGSYRIDAQRTSLVARTYKAGFAKSQGHDHAIRATQVGGTVAYVPGHPEQDRIAISVATDGLVVDDERAREAAHLGAGPSESQRRSIDKTMRSSDQLDTARFHTIEFKSTHVDERAGGELVVTGAFTLHGVTRTVVVPVRVRDTGGGLTATGSFDLRQSDFGIKPYSSFMGAVKNQDRITVTLEVTAVR